MSLRSLARRLLAVAALAAAAPLAASAQPSSLTFFGDSFTDTGNGDILSLALLGVDLTPSPPYAMGVITDGPNWAQRLATAFGRPADAAPSLLPVGSRNYAIGTARTGVLGGGGRPIGLLSQLGVHNGTCAFGPLCPPARAGDPTGLYTVYGGSLDVFDAAALATPVAREAALQTAVGNVATVAQGLYLAGARQFLIPNVANVGRSPAGMTNPAGPALLGELSARFNTILGARLGLLSAALPGSTFYGLSLDVLFDNILRDATYGGGALYGITNTTVPCFLLPPGACAVSAFVDDLHPTTVVHGLIADAAYRRVALGVDVTAIPEPGTVVLVGSALAILGLASRRRRQG